MSQNQSSQTAVFYLRSGGVRVSDVLHGLARQRVACQQRANELNLQVLGEYVDHGGTAEPTDQPSLSKLLGDLATMKPNYVITFDHDRIARKVARYASIAWTIAKSGSRLEIASAPHYEADEHTKQLISYIGSVQLTDTTPDDPANQEHEN
ncbi:DNA invertase Pin-like site-specific DNA recombinase [Amycolatopsis lexingtonensis]|uniref:DNA invertase Pin-like site-specific DNA recombinase n=1 Tax=Amycolatopsis lexingtonensis TaxID=218822 RepID=A0ABR9ICK4_9PSEU|nr:recombinase family protein [Amycolatopsis lexingtonensis]MBE1500914.1 DNA invertase Pin-like site-specific DNA recombinase [Amycolatopsis lexingtonensis]